MSFEANKMIDLGGASFPCRTLSSCRHWLFLPFSVYLIVAVTVVQIPRSLQGPGLAFPFVHWVLTGSF